MADKKITQLTNITGANLVDADEFVVVDISADETKAITLGELKEAFDSGSGFVRITGDTMTGDLALSGADVTFGDNDKAIFGGATSELQIYSDGSNSFIEDTGTGNLKVIAQDFILNSQTPANMITAYQNAAVSLFYSGAAKLATTSTGVDIKNVASGANAKLNITTESTGGGTSEILFSDNTTGRGRIYYDHGSSPEELHIETTGTDAIVIDNSQNVTIPNGNLDITGTLTSDGLTVDGDAVFTTGDTIRLDTSDGSDNGVLAVSGGGANSDARGARVRLYGNEHASLGGALDIGAGNVSSGHIYNYTNAKLRQKIDYNGDISFYDSTGTTPKFFWDASAEQLQIGSLDNGSNPAVLAIKSDANGHALTIEEPAGAGESWQIGVDADGDLGFYNSTSTTASVTFDDSGQVGIGDTAPSEKLNVAGNIMLEGANQYLYLTNVGTGNSGIYIRGITADSTLRSHSTGIFTWEVTGSEKMRIDSSGNVGIGSSSNTGAALHVDPATNVTTAFGTPLIKVGGANSWAGNGSIYSIGFGYNNGSTVKSPAEIGFDTTSAAGVTKGDLVFATRDVTTDTAPTERMRINSSGDWMVSNTVANVASGFSAQAGCGWVDSDTHFEIATTSNRAALEVGKNNANDGTLVTFRKQNATVGGIGTVGGDLYIASSDTGHEGLRLGNGAITPVNSAGASTDAASNLGGATSRFKDLYLSGGVVFGSTGGLVTSKTLDDYEEGTWTPVAAGDSSSGTASYSIQSGTYTKIGNMVYIMGRLGWSGHTGSGNLIVNGLPFSSNNQYAFLGFSFRDFLTITAGKTAYADVLPNAATVAFREIGTGTSASSRVAMDTAVIDVSFSGFYMTNA